MMRSIPLLIRLAPAILLTARLPVSLSRPQESAVVFKTDVRIVEVYAMVQDSRGRYVEGLQPSQFEIRDNGELQPITSFEPIATGFDCAILLDSTGSMESAMPALKAAVLQLIDAFRDQDRFAVYTFNTTLRRMQDYSRDKASAKQAVLRIMPRGGTALFDSLSGVAADLAKRKGKKAIIAFTDGQDNSSYLHSTAVIAQGKSLGIAIYALAQGEALAAPQLFQTLKAIARATGGQAYEVRNSSQVSRVFSEISDDLRHAYMLTYAAPPAYNGDWHSIQVTVKGVQAVQVRAREGYFPK